ncbi:MAG: transporter substrate-binding domain-containing protein, partial [Clostridia bacterium]|nr:transporter substrate-binding domain-containing protein [Clostridia bacterium]
MKKLLTLALALMMLFAMTACATGQEADGQPVLTVAMSPDFSPMEFVDTSKTGQDQYVGFDVTLANYIADELGMTLEIQPMSFDACQTAVQLGTVDMSISGFSWTAERAENYAISDYYIAGDNETEQVIITTADKAGTLTTAEAFSGLKVAAQAASLQELLCIE